MSDTPQHLRWNTASAFQDERYVELQVIDVTNRVQVQLAEHEPEVIAVDVLGRGNLPFSVDDAEKLAQALLSAVALSRGQTA